MKLRLHLDAWLTRLAPAEALRALRACIGTYCVVYLAARGAHLLRVVDLPARSFRPIGLLAWLAEPLPAAALYALYAAALGLAIAFARGLLYSLVAPLLSLSLTALLTYRHCWGMIFHTDNLLVLHVVLLSLAPAGRTARGPSRRAGAVLNAMQLVTVSTYLLAGLAKLSATGPAWALGGVLRQQIAYDALRKMELGSTYSPFGVWLLQAEWLFAPLSAFALGAELLAPLALLGGRVALLWCVAAWAFHFGVLVTMAIAFPYPLSGCGFLCLISAERLAGARRALVRRYSARKWLRPAAAARSAAGR